MFALKCQTYTPPPCSNVSTVCAVHQVLSVPERAVFPVVCPGLEPAVTPGAGIEQARAGPDRPCGPSQASRSSRARRQQRGLCLGCRKPDSAAKSSSCLQGLLETSSAGVPLGWERSLPDVLAGSLCLRMAWGQGRPKGFTSRIPSSTLPEGVIKVQGFVFSFLPYPRGLYLKIAETCGKTCCLPHMLGLKLRLASPSATCP